MKRVRKTFSKAEKCSILDEYFRHKCSMVKIANKYGIDPVTLARWKRQMSDKDPSMSHSKAKLIAQQAKDQETIKLLKKMVAELSLDKEILSEAVEIYKKKIEEDEKQKSRKK